MTGLLNYQSKYQLLPGAQKADGSLRSVLLILFLMTISAMLGALGGRRTLDRGHCPQFSYSNPGIPLNTHEQIFIYNRTFGADPQADGQTIAAWDSIVPLGQGTVRHPPESKNISTLSVVHQLHCLWSIHQIYYAALHTTTPFDEHDHRSRHARHCFDYLRQSLLCAVDATLEPVDPVLGGVTGWGNRRVCRDYEALKEWAARRRVSDARGFSDQD